MNFGSSERWPVLRQLHEVYAISFGQLAIAANKNEGTIARRAKREGWLSGGQGSFDLNAINNLVGDLMTKANSQIDEIIRGGDGAEVAEKQLRISSALILAANKFLQTRMQLQKNNTQKQDDGADEAGNAGEDILALRADVEAFIVSIGEEECDPQISGEIEQ